MWVFKRYDANNKLSSVDNLNNEGYIQFIGTWEFKENENIPVTPNDSNNTNKDNTIKNESVNNKQSAKTGDHTNIGLYLSLFAMSACCMICLILYKNKKE